MQLKEYLSKIHDDKEKRAALKAAAEEGREKEFLAAEGVELPEQAAASGELSDNELSAVAGGDVSYELRKDVYKTDSRGNPTHWKRYYLDGHYAIIHYICEKCGGVLHKGSFGLYYCDPCDEHYWDPEKVVDEKSW